MDRAEEGNFMIVKQQSLAQISHANALTEHLSLQKEREVPIAKYF